MKTSVRILSLTTACIAGLVTSGAILAQSETSSGLPQVSVEPRDIGRCGEADLVGMRGNSGAVLACSCPADDYISGDIWGSETYTDDTHICTAAYHAGALTRGRGGTATLQLTGSQESFPAATRNGLESRDWGPYEGSFRFVEYRPGSVSMASSDRTPRDIGRCADADLTRMRADAGALLSCSCPADTHISGDIWGTDTYTDDTHICTAAYHAGVLQRGAGGTAVFELSGPQEGFSSSIQNDLESRDWGAYEGSFTFVH